MIPFLFAYAGVCFLTVQEVFHQLVTVVKQYSGFGGISFAERKMDIVTDSLTC
jgi:peptide methionine sulfoxide reductase MsrA